jgi:hypothetical protein
VKENKGRKEIISKKKKEGRRWAFGPHDATTRIDHEPKPSKARLVVPLRY